MNKRVVPPTVEKEVNEEFSFHVDMRVRELVEMGWDAGDARAKAIRRFGDIERVKADCRQLGTRRDVSMNRRLWWDEIVQDLGYALRQLRRAPSFAAITVLTLGIAIGANTAVFSVVNGVLLAPLPFPEPDELAVLWTRYLPESGFDIDKFSMSGPEYLDIHETSTALESSGAFQRGSNTLTGDGGDAERIGVGLLSSDVLPTLNVAPHSGRWFTPEEDVAEGPNVVILGFDLWTNRYGGDESIVGRTIMLNGVGTEVVGVMPAGFEFPRGTDAWLPLGLDRTSEGGRGQHSYTGIGRLASGKTMADLDAELAVFRDRWAAEYEHNVAHYAWANSYRAEAIQDAPTRLRLLMAAVALVLLIACVNVANLLTARGEQRHGEVAVRTALGAGRGRITRQLATESLVLAGASALLGLGIAVVGTRVLIAIDPAALPRLADVSVDANVLGFTLAISVLTAGLFGIAPAYLIGRHSSPTVSGSAGRTVGGRRTSKVPQGARDRRSRGEPDRSDPGGINGARLHGAQRHRNQYGSRRLADLLAVDSNGLRAERRGRPRRVRSALGATPSHPGRRRGHRHE